MTTSTIYSIARQWSSQESSEDSCEFGAVGEKLAKSIPFFSPHFECTYVVLPPAHRFLMANRRKGALLPPKISTVHTHPPTMIGDVHGHFKFSCDDRFLEKILRIFILLDDGSILTDQRLCRYNQEISMITFCR